MIELRHVSVNNLQGIDLDLPYGKLIVFCGRSGSGKSSLAIDTLYAEGQRRYIETFSAYTRQFLEKLEKPDAERIEGVPPAVAVTTKSLQRMNRSTVGTATEALEYLRLLFARIGRVECPCCGREIQIDTPQTVLEWAVGSGQWAELGATSSEFPANFRMQIAFAPILETDKAEFEATWKSQGFLRGIIFDQTFRLDDGGIPDDLYQKALSLTEAATRESENPQATQGFLFDNNVDSEKEEIATEIAEDDIETETETKSTSSFFLDEMSSPRTVLPQQPNPRPAPLLFIVDRVTLGATEESRIIDSLEKAFEHGDGRCFVLVQKKDGNAGFERKIFSRRFSCEDCGVDFPTPEPNLFSFNSPLGACPCCEGFGNLMMYDLDLIVPDKTKTIRGGAVAPWSTPSYAPKLDELLVVAESIGVPVNIPFKNLTEEQLQRFLYGISQEKKNVSKSRKRSAAKFSDSWTGLSGFFERLERQKYKMHIRVFLSRWRSYRPCPECNGSRLRREAIFVRINGCDIAELSERKISDLSPFFESLADSLKISEREFKLARTPLEQIRLRLKFLNEVGLGYLTLSRPMRTLSGGEQRRVGLTSALGSSLVDMLYVLDEPSVGLHPTDTDRLLESIRKLRDRGNTVVLVEHEESVLRSADWIVEIGPGAGESGGKVVFQGTPEEMIDDEQSLTGNYLSGKRTGQFGAKRRLPENGVIEIVGCRGNNLKNLTVAFPLGMLCVVTGVSGAGKTSLVCETLYPALCQHLGKELGKESGKNNAQKILPFDRLVVGDMIEDVVLVDQSPIGRSPRSNPVTYLKIFDEIRNVFAETPDAKARHYTAGRFSFNVEGGRCEHCKGDGYIVVDMQFMSDMLVRCTQCRGKRYRPEILEILYRGRSIAEVLDMTVREAFGFFRGRSKVQQKLKRLIDVGLEYVRLGQPANTLSGGESQRLKLAAYLSQVKKGRTLFLLDEPTTGLHFADVVQLLDCFDALLETGHSLIIVEHNLQMIRAADYVIDLGPGAAEAGGLVVAQGTPEEVAESEDSATGKTLAAGLAPHCSAPQCRASSTANNVDF